MTRNKTKERSSQRKAITHLVDSTSKLHPRNLHQGRYDLSVLSTKTPSLKHYLIKNVRGDETIDFTNPEAVLTLNQALLAYYYNVSLWQLPKGYLCPPIPGRADYIHYLADLLSGSHKGIIPKGKQVKVLDVGCGANCIYPIIGSQSYGWKFLGADIDLVSVNCAKNIVQSNASLNKHITVVHQSRSDKYFEGLVKEGEYYDLTMCNPPFYDSMAQAQANNLRKQQNLKVNHAKRSGKKNSSKLSLGLKRNFGGQASELWCQGGELAFVLSMVEESVLFQTQVGWFTSLISNNDNVKQIKKKLAQVKADDVKVFQMSQGNKTSRFIAWKFE